MSFDIIINNDNFLKHTIDLVKVFNNIELSENIVFMSLRDPINSNIIYKAYTDLGRPIISKQLFQKWRQQPKGLLLKYYISDEYDFESTKNGKIIRKNKDLYDILTQGKEFKIEKSKVISLIEKEDFDSESHDSKVH